MIIHPLGDLLRQRIYGIGQGYEDLNDHERLREDALLQSVLERDESLSSAPTLCRMENRASRAEMWALQRQLVESFIASFKRAPEELVLDFDATDDPLHGKQDGRSFTATTIATAICRCTCSAAMIAPSNETPQLKGKPRVGHANCAPQARNPHR